MIEVKSHFTDWHTVTEKQALRYAAVLYGGMVCRNKVDKVHSHIRGISFTEEQMRNELNNRNQRGGKGTQ